MRCPSKWTTAIALVLGGAACSKKVDKQEGNPGAAGSATPAATAPGTPPKTSPAAGAREWNADPVAFAARWVTEGEATKKAKPARLTGMLRVGPTAVRLDIDVHPNSQGPVSLIRVHGESDLWKINPAAKHYNRALSGDWEHDLVPRIIEAADVEDIAKGECPFGRAKPDDCKQVGTAQVAGRTVQEWQFKKWTLWIDPTLRTALKTSYTPYRNNPGTQLVELSDVAIGDQDAALFKVPADFECGAGAFCESAPK